jgi:hypothetical protein
MDSKRQMINILLIGSVTFGESTAINVDVRNQNIIPPILANSKRKVLSGIFFHILKKLPCNINENHYIKK